MKYTCHSGYLSTAINENDLATVLTPAGGIFHALRVPGQEVEYGDTIGEILGPFTAEIVAPVTATTNSKCPLRKFRRGRFMRLPVPACAN